MRCVSDYDGWDRIWRFGDTVTWRSISEDDFNFYLHGLNSSGPVGSSNYTRLPKYAFVRAALRVVDGKEKT